MSTKRLDAIQTQVTSLMNEALLILSEETGTGYGTDAGCYVGVDFYDHTNTGTAKGCVFNVSIICDGQIIQLSTNDRFTLSDAMRRIVKKWNDKETK